MRRSLQPSEAHITTMMARARLQSLGRTPPPSSPPFMRIYVDGPCRGCNLRVARCRFIPLRVMPAAISVWSMEASVPPSTHLPSMLRRATLACLLYTSDAADE